MYKIYSVKVIINSVSLNFDSGVSQGSVLALLLIILYTNDLPNFLSKTKSIYSLMMTQQCGM